MDVSSFLGGNFLTHLDLPQPFQQWTIAKADQQLVGSDQKICLTFSEFPSKPLACNKTNLRVVAELYSTNAESWAGKQLLVYRTRTQFQGQPKLCVRVSNPHQPPPEPVLDPQGNPVTYPSAGAGPVAAPQPPVQPPGVAPWVADDNSPPAQG